MDLQTTTTTTKTTNTLRNEKEEDLRFCPPGQKECWMLFCFFFFFLFCVFLSRPFVLLCSSADELRPRARKLCTDRREEEYKKQAFYVLYVFLTVFDELWSRDEFPLLLLDMFCILRGRQLEHTSIGPWRMLYCIIHCLRLQTVIVGIGFV